MIFHQDKNKNLLACPLGHYCLATALARDSAPRTTNGYSSVRRILMFLQFKVEIEHMDKF